MPSDTEDAAPIWGGNVSITGQRYAELLTAEARLATAEAALREAMEAGQTLLALSVSCFNTAAEERAWEEAAEVFAAPPTQEGLSVFTEGSGQAQ